MKRTYFNLLPVLVLLLGFGCAGNPAGSDDDDGDGNGAATRPAKLISGGTFSMGSVNGSSDEQPVHAVTVSSFYMDSTEVTQADYDAVMESAYPAYDSPPWWAETQGLGDNHPAYSVEWDEAVLYCNARSIQEGLDTVYTYTAIDGTPGNACELTGLSYDFGKNGYRLPTEAEWEYAARGGAATDFSWGKDNQSYPSTAADTAEISSYAVWSVAAWDLGPEAAGFGTHEVAGLAPNGYGLYDMSGNVYEWVHDWYGAYTADAQTDPTGPDTESYHFMRGGSWGNRPEYITVSNRSFSVPGYIGYFYGFRAVRNAP